MEVEYLPIPISTAKGEAISTIQYYPNHLPPPGPPVVQVRGEGGGLGGRREWRGHLDDPVLPQPPATPRPPGGTGEGRGREGGGLGGRREGRGHLLSLSQERSPPLVSCRFHSDLRARISSPPTPHPDVQIPLGSTGEDVIAARRQSGSNSLHAGSLDNGSSGNAVAAPTEEQLLHRRFPSTGVGGGGWCGSDSRIHGVMNGEEVFPGRCMW